MKPQTMSEERFFEEVCDLLGLDYTDSDEDNVIHAINKLREQNNELKNAVSFWHKAWKDLRQMFISR